jgi:hypothetical protein
MPAEEVMVFRSLIVWKSKVSDMVFWVWKIRGWALPIHPHWCQYLILTLGRSLLLLLPYINGPRRSYVISLYISRKDILTVTHSPVIFSISLKIIDSVWGMRPCLRDLLEQKDISLQVLHVKCMVLMLCQHLNLFHITQNRALDSVFSWELSCIKGLC